MDGIEAEKSRYLDRALTWLGFNGRVLEEAADPANAILERLRFLGIFASNLDEFFMIRVAGVRELVLGNVEHRTAAGLTPAELTQRIATRSRDVVAQAYALWDRELIPALREGGVHVLGTGELEPKERAFLDRLFAREILPILTPAAIDPALPFPRLVNLALHLAVRL